MELIDAIKNRRSIREYNNKKIDDEKINIIIEAGIWAPSGKNGQPWRFKVIKERNLIEKVSVLSVYRNWLRTSACQIAVFLDNKSSYNYVKDIQSCGAAIQNMLLCAYSLGIGSYWIGEILPNAKIVKKLCGIENDDYELMAVIALGYYDTPIIQGERKATEEFLI